MDQEKLLAFANALQGMGAHFQGNGAQWEAAQASMAQAKADREAQAKKDRQTQGVARKKRFREEQEFVDSRLAGITDPLVIRDRLAGMQGAVSKHTMKNYVQPLMDMSDADLAGRFAQPTEDPAEWRTLQATLEAAGYTPGTPEYQQAAQIALGMAPRKVGSSAQTIAETPGATEAVGESEAFISGSKAAADQAITISGQAFEKLGKARVAGANIKRAIKALNNGAKTGAIQQHLPSITAASVELDNARSSMGLDVVGVTTFGALSKGELDLALDTAIPIGLDEPELKEWLRAKGRAQRKMVTELERMATYLGTPGNTLAKYLKQMEKRGKFKRGDAVPEGHTPLQPEDGGPQRQLMEDANGNRAYVYPDGRVEEVK